MNLQPQPDESQERQATDPALDAAVRDALAAEPVPADLEQRILALTDPSLNALLDEVLAPEQAPDGLTDRILAATSHQAIGTANIERPVLARIAFQALRYSAAAAVVFAAGLGIYVATQSQTGGPDNTVTDSGTTSANPATAQAETFEDYFAAADLDGSFAVDDKIEQLDSQISSVGNDFWGGEEDFQQELWDELIGDGSSL